MKGQRMAGNKTCSTGKSRFATVGGAKARLQQIMDDPDPTRLYQPNGVASCPKCNGYHLTSKSGKQWSAGKHVRDRRVS